MTHATENEELGTNLTELQISTQKLQLSLHTVMNPNGVTQEEWKAMFDGERCSFIENVKYVNEYIKLFNNYFKKCSPEELAEHSINYKEHFKEELIINHPLLQIQSLDSMGNVQETIKALKTVKLVRRLLVYVIDGLYFRDVGPLDTIITNCTILLESFKAPLTPIQFVQADKAHKKGIKGAGAKIIVIEQDLYSGHSFLKNTPQIKVNELSENCSHSKESEGHGAHVTGIVHQIAPDAEIFVYQSIYHVDKNPSSITPTSKIINTSYATPIPLLHLISEKKQQAIKGILSTDRTRKSYVYKMIEGIFRNTKQFKDTMQLIYKASDKPPSDSQCLFQNEGDQEEYENGIKDYEKDYAGTVLPPYKRSRK